MLFGKLVILRPLEPEDLERIREFRNDPEVRRLLAGFSTGYSAADMQEWLERGRKNLQDVRWAILERQGNLVIGHVGLYQIDWINRQARIGIMIGDSTFTSKGLGTEVTQLVIHFAFSQMNLHHINAYVLSYNERSIRMFRKIGFCEEGRLREANFKDSKYNDIAIFGILREEYQEKYAL
jgi:RimJ/RimL family protein N-acetyltransferase